jgi:hypothetical protein
MIKELWFWTLMVIANLSGVSVILWLFSYPDTVVFLTGFIGVLVQISIDKKVLDWKYKKNVEKEKEYRVQRRKW